MTAVPGSRPARAFVVRSATVDDLPGVEAVARETWHATYAGAMPEADIERFVQANYGQDALHRRLANLGRGFSIASDASGVIGFSCLGRNRDDAYELFAIYVLPAYQRHGVGSALWRMVDAEVRRLDASEFHLWVLSSNERARSFYTAMGGQPADTRSFLIGETEINETRFEFWLGD